MSLIYIPNWYLYKKLIFNLKGNPESNSCTKSYLDGNM